MELLLCVNHTQLQRLGFQLPGLQLDLKFKEEVANGEYKRGQRSWWSCGLSAAKQIESDRVARAS